MLRGGFAPMGMPIEDGCPGSRRIPAESLLFCANGGMLLSLNPGLNPQSMAQETQRSGPMSRPLWALRGQGGGRWKAAQFRLQLPAEIYAGSYLWTLTATMLRGLYLNSVHFQSLYLPADHEFLQITLEGLTGGHSGMDIQRGRANANKLMNRFLYAAALRFAVRLAWIDGGGLRNAIPRESRITGAGGGAAQVPGGV